MKPPGELPPGRAVVNLRSGTPAQAHELAAWLADQGVDHLDGSIMADPENEPGPACAGRNQRGVPQIIS